MRAKIRHGAAKKQLMGTVEQGGGRVLQVEAKWRFHELRATVSNAALCIDNPQPISNSNNVSFSRTCKQLKKEKKLREVRVAAEECDHETYLRFASFSAGDLLSRRLREHILPELFSAYSKEGFKPNDQLLRSLEDFVLDKPLEMQLPEFTQFKQELVRLSKELFWALSYDLSENAKGKRERFPAFFSLYIRCGSVAIPRLVGAPSSVSLFSCLEKARDGGLLSPESLVVADKISNLYKESKSLILRFLRKSIYHQYCHTGRPGQGPLYLENKAVDEIGHRFRDFIKNFYSDKEMRQGKTSPFDFRLIEEKEQRQKLLQRLFDANWCRSRTIIFLEHT